MIRARNWVLLATAVLWGTALTYSATSARALYADGARFVSVLLLNPHRFWDYDFQRTFASLISQTPVLLGQRMGMDSVAAYAAIYAFGVFVIPAVMMVAALFLSRCQPALFAANGLAIVIYGFGANFINTEANLFFGLVWLSVTILALQDPAPILRSVLLPALAIAMLRAYEGMLLVGPILALWAFLSAARESDDHRARNGLMIAVLLYLLGATIGLGGFLSPRDLNNATGFLATILSYLHNPQIFLLLSGLAAAAGICLSNTRSRIALVVMVALLGIAFFVSIVNLDGFYSYSIYYQNRAFMVLSLPAFVGALFVVYWQRPTWLGTRPDDVGSALLLVPLAFAVAGDIVGTYRWNVYIHEFCRVLDTNATPLERLQSLKSSGAHTAWAWTHPTMSVLLRDRGSMAMVVNEPGAFRWEPFDPAQAPSIAYRGLCQAHLLGPSRPDSFDLPMNFTQGSFPSYVASATGLSKTENWATWSEGPTVEFRFARSLPQSFDLSLRIGAAFGGNKGAPVKVRAGQQEIEFTVDREPTDVTIPFRQIGDADTISFHMPAPESPQERGMGDDARKLGIAFIMMTLAPR